MSHIPMGFCADNLDPNNNGTTWYRYCSIWWAAGIESASLNALSVLDISHKVYGAISINTPSNTPRLSGSNRMFMDSNREQHR